MTRRIRPGLIVSVALTALPALAQTDAPASGANAPAPTAAPSNAAEAHEQAMTRMHMALTAEQTGDADVDFARGMIPHHQGAIDMARIQLQFGDDPELRRMAEEIIRAQEAEIATLQDWLQRNAPDAAGTGSMSANMATGAGPEPKPMTGSRAPEAKPAPDGTPETKPAN